MHPDLFRITVPEFLRSVFPHYLTIHTYGACIAIGVYLAIWYTIRQSKKELGLNSDPILSLALIIIISAFIGGKIFYYLEKPSIYLANPEKMLNSMGAGFVFYGSLLFAIPSVLWYLKKNKILVWPMLDIMAITICIVHGFGRLGCFFAGCCHGLPSDAPFAVVFSNPACAADIKTMPVHPTQLYEVVMILIIALILQILRQRKQFNGQIFLVYIMLYGIGRSFIEIFRGDSERGFIIPAVISYSQLISFLLIIAAAALYWRLKKSNQS